ncbi:recombinase RecT [Acinetobacter bereziniae]|uniref:RecT family recombinase n=1 Tax=Acinetobacter bereziniae TaxID=106648 RepID=UPI001904494B|nr:RecT family recombinase [Acinetobacter bereziniae]QQC81909.1 recombinase RecT [Acinetobacter bereziniae]UUN95028.1 recombinase RecT [Acinetobacter bereziniae]
MNALTTPQNGQIAHLTAFDIMMNPEIMDRFERIASVMASSKFAVPKHLQGNTGDCLAIIMQSAQWQMDPFAVAQKTHQINGVLGYEAQLVNAVITNRAPITGRLNFEWYGDWAKINGKEDKSWDKGIKVWATLKGETSPREIDISMGQVGSVRNSPLWVSDPRQQLAYLAIKRWSRLYTPDVILGVYTPDEIAEREELDVTPAQSMVKKHQGSSGLKAQMAEREQSQETVIDMAPIFDVEGLINQINALSTIEELKALAKTIPADLGEPAKTNISTAYANRKNYVQLLVDLDGADTIELINSIMAERFEPNTSSMSDEQIDEVSALFERKSAELTP